MNSEIVILIVGHYNSGYRYEFCIYSYSDYTIIFCNHWIDDISSFNEGIGIFSKAYHLENRDAILIYFTNLNSNSLKLTTGAISNNSNIFNKKIEQNLDESNNYKFDTDVRRNDFVKIDSKRFIYTGISMNDNKTMYIYLIDLYNDYNSMNIRIYQENFNNEHKLYLEISSDVYNNHLIFTSTAIKTNNEIYSFLMIFGYANYTDSTINISEYFMDDYINNEKNLFELLLGNIQIENNIFQYYIERDEIKLVSIPNEILFYNKTSPSVVPIANGDHLSKNYTFKQNVTSEKSNEYYYLDYQPIIKEPTYENYYNGTINYIEFNKIDYYQTNYKQKLYYGRTITVQFKLCHKYCEKCIKYGYNDSSQFCLSCLPDYRYFKDEEFNNSNCVPEGYFYDKEENILNQCNETNSKFYINLTDLKKICFKSIYDCPEEYPYLNTTNNECLNITLPILTTIPQIPSTVPYIPTTLFELPTTLSEVPTTMPEIITIIPKMPSTIPNIPTTLLITGPETTISNLHQIYQQQF